jgi:hypothetical protein
MTLTPPAGPDGEPLLAAVLRLGFGRMVVSEKEVPIILASLV